MGHTITWLRNSTILDPLLLASRITKNGANNRQKLEKNVKLKLLIICFQTFKPNFGNIKLNKGFFQLIGTMQLSHNLSLKTSEKSIKNGRYF